MRSVFRPLSSLFFLSLPLLGGCDSEGEADGTPDGGVSTAPGAMSGGGATTLDPGGSDGVGGGDSSQAAGGESASAGGTTDGGESSGSGGESSNADGGSESSGGSGIDGGSEGTRVCGSAEEEGTVTLSCPDGEVIDSVLFASYGTPEGSCESFAQGDCHADTSESFVTSRCVGRSTCTLAATNASFGDPCENVPKSVAIALDCVEGEATEEPDGPYKGVANSPAAELTSLGAAWCYNWMSSPQRSDCDDPYFIPMVWGGDNVRATVDSIASAGYTTLLGFNEPNKSDQANLSVAEVLALWPDLTSNTNIRVSSPAVSDDARAWLEEFMSEVQDRGLRVDFIAMHWYGWNEGSCVASQLEAAVNWASQWGLPVWITEFGCMGSSNTDEQTLLDFFDNAIPMLAAHPLVERYAWYPWNTYNELYVAGENEERIMTPLGEAFANSP